MVAIARQLVDESPDSRAEARSEARISRSHTVRELARRWRDHRDERARDRLLYLHMPLIEAIANRYPARLGREDFVQEGQLGFLRALETFDPDRGVELATYARHWVRAYVHRYLLKTWGIVPRFTTHEKRRVFFGAGHARRALGLTSPTDGDETIIARKLKVKPETVLEVEQARSIRDEPLEVSDDDPRERFASHLPGPEEATWDAERARLLRERLPRALEGLDERERMIFLHRYDPDESTPLEILGSRLGVTRERARQLECRARRKLAASFADLVPDEVAAEALKAPPPRRRRARAQARA
jgi:RNA polymerase sigma-32 factor